MLEVEIASRCEVGGRERNEDDLRHGGAGSTCYAVLSDGAGGHRGGAVASDLVVRITALHLQALEEASPDALHALVTDAHDALVQKQDRRLRDRMHATVVALWLDRQQQEALWSHVGDSRLYLLRQGRVRHVTRDDSVVQRMVDAGYLTPEEALVHPQKNQLISAMGAEAGVNPSSLDTPMRIQDGDAFLLCSDGWWEHFDHRAIEEAFAQAHSPDEWLDTMAFAIREASRPNQDNYSAIAVWIGDPAETTRLADVWEDSDNSPI